MSTFDRPSNRFIHSSTPEVLYPDKLTKLKSIMSDPPKRKKTTIMIPLDKWKEIKAFCADQEITIAQIFLDGYEQLRKDATTALHKDGMPSGGDAA